ncbi:hypothetical protein PISMIDRAFT_687401, partial [Pisolithus microcarpus 441]
TETGADGLGSAFTSEVLGPCPRPRDQSPDTTATQKMRTDDVCLRFGKQYETIQI